MKFLLHGHGCEYVLKPLAEDLSRRGFTVIEADSQETDITPLVQSLIGSEVCYVTSAHLLLDSCNFNQYYESTFPVLSPLEIKKLLKPSCSVFVPHDLSSPILQEEVPYIRLFSLFAAPTPQWNCVPYAKRTEILGWPKAGTTSIPVKTSKTKEHLNALWFVSNIVNNLSKGTDAFVQWLEPLTSRGCAIKLPLWHGTDEIEKILKKSGVTVIPATTNTFSAMNQAELIITNGSSSVVTESVLFGKKTVNILSRLEWTDESSAFSHFPEVAFCSSPDKALEAGKKAGCRNRSIQPFDTERFLSIVSEITNKALTASPENSTPSFLKDSDEDIANNTPKG